MLLRKQPLKDCYLLKVTHTILCKILVRKCMVVLQNISKKPQSLIIDSVFSTLASFGPPVDFLDIHPLQS